MKRIRFNEVVARDGLQAEPRFVATEDKIALIDALGECGYAKIEVTSFVSPKAVPALRDAAEVMHGIRRVAGVTYAVLVANARGAERALQCRPDEINLVMSVSEAHNAANLGMTREGSFAVLSEVIAAVRGSVAVNVSLSTAFGCPLGGAVSLAQVLHWASRFADLGVRGFTFCDTTGMAHPGQVARMAIALQQAFAGFELAFHFHDTRGMGMANVLTAVERGIDRFDGSLGGLGGCPYAPGATGNVCSEDVLHMLEAMGWATGVDLDRILGIARGLPALVGHGVPGRLVEAGTVAEAIRRHAVAAV